MVEAVVVQGWLWSRVPCRGYVPGKKCGKQEEVEGCRGSCDQMRCTLYRMAAAESQAEVRWQD